MASDIVDMGKRFKRLREARGMSLRDVAAAVEDGPNHSTLNRFEAGNDLLLSSFLKGLEGIGVTLPQFLNENCEHEWETVCKLCGEELVLFPASGERTREGRAVG